jgi:2-polyprenyl-6-methoxyphenol hydroxylase-like FAD-dependent oxidoreductase
MTDPAAIIAGAGPTGLMLGAELTLAGVNVLIIEKRVNKERIQPGALGLHARVEVVEAPARCRRFLRLVVGLAFWSRLRAMCLTTAMFSGP